MRNIRLFTLAIALLCTYSVFAAVTSTHQPGTYESSTGYNVQMTSYQGRSYETYFISWKNSKLYVGIGGSYVTTSTTPRVPGFDGVANGDITSTDGWLNINAAGYSGSNTSPAAEFAVSSSSNSTHYAQIQQNKNFTIKIKGYDQFSFGGRDNGNQDGKKFVVTINNQVQNIDHSTTDWHIWRFDLDPNTEYTIVVSGDGNNANRLRAFSLRVPETPTISTDATLKSLKYNNTSVPNFSSTTYSYDVELPAGTTAIPTVTAEKNDDKASDPVITQATGLPGSATVSVTAEDGETTLTYTIHFTVASSLPKVLTATWPNIKGTAVVDNVGMTITGQVTNGSGLTSITPSFTGNNIANYTPQGAQDFTAPVNYVFSNANMETTQYTVTITEAPAISTDATLKSLKYNGTSVPGFSPTIYEYNVTVASNASVPTVTAEANDVKANAVVTQAQSLPGIATVVVTAEDITVTRTYKINFTVTVPVTTLTTHEPEVYEAEKKAGGYGCKLIEFSHREYEVFYINRDNSGSNLAIATSNGDKAGSISDDSQLATAATITRDGWAKISSNGTGGDANAVARDEFQTSIRSVKLTNTSHSLEMHIQGYDQFSFYGKDNNSDASKNKMFEVYIDNVKQTRSPMNAYGIERYEISTGEHVIRITGSAGAGDNKLCSFSLRLAQEPKTKLFKGNDSTQVVLQTMDIKKVLYTTKYNNIEGAETHLEWIGNEGTDIVLSEKEGSMVDTLTLNGKANCPVGTYHYAVVATLKGAEKSRVAGKFSVISDIKSLDAIEVEGYQGEEIDQIRFRYYALSASAVTLTWPNGQPQGISGNGQDGIYIIGGTTNTTGIYPYEISVLGADTVIKGKLTIRELNYGQNPVLYLYKNSGAAEKDGTYMYLNGTGTDKWNLISRKAKTDGLRPTDQYSKYKWILISEDVDADNPEVLAIARGEVALPVLNMKAFTYTPGRLNWGEPDNGSLTDNGRFITVYRDDHPIFQALNKHKGDSIMVLDTIEGKGLMPIDVNNLDNSLCLATALTRDINDYYGDGPKKTIMHEVVRPDGKKYICLPMGIEGSKHLTTDGQRLINQTITYLLSSDATIKAPSLAITQFRVGNYTGVIDDENNVIELKVKEEDSELMKAAEPVITLADPMTFVTPNSGEAVNFIDAPYGIRYVVSDYVTKRNYNVIVRLYNPQGIDNIEVGTWLNIFDVYGRKVATTNQDIRTMDLPHGMYIVVTESGQTIKIMR